MFDTLTGNLVLNEHLQLSQFMSINEFQQQQDISLWSKETLRHDFWLTKDCVDSKERRVRVKLHFYQDKLQKIQLFYYLPKEQEMVSGGYNPYNDAERDQYHQQIRSELVGNTQPYDLERWGAILLGVNAKHNLSMLIIDYTYGRI